MDGWKLAQYTVGGVIFVALVGIVAKDGSQLGEFMKATSDAFGGFAKSLGSLG